MSDSPVIGFINKAFDLIVLNFIWLVCCLPIVTIGASTTAMYYVCIISIRQGDGYVVKRFFKAFKENFAKSTIVWICLLIFAAVFAFDMWFWYQIDSGISKAMLAISGAIMVVIVLVTEYIFPVLAKFEGDIKLAVRNSAAMAVGYLPYTIALLIVDILFTMANIKSIAANVVSIFVGFALITYVKSFLIYRVFMNHMDERFDDFERDRLLDESKSSGESKD